MILDIFKYFASFPSIDGVKDCFSWGDSGNEGYAPLLNYICSMTEHSRIPEIKDYIFAPSEKVIKERINAAKGTFLFVDYGTIASNIDSRNSIEDSFEMALTIADKIDANRDLVEYALVSEQTLLCLSKLQAMMLKDQASVHWIKQITNYKRIPFEYPEYNAVGWTMMFNREGADILELKEKIKEI